MKKKAKEKRERKILITGFVVLVVGLLAFFVGLHLLQSQRATNEWPTVQGKVVDFKFEKHVEIRKYVNVSYEVIINYTYRVREKQYFSAQYSTNGDYVAKHLRDVRYLEERYPKGQAVQVYYNPKEPKESLLIPGETGSANYLFVVSVCCLLFAMVMIAPRIRMMKRSGK